MFTDYPYLVAHDTLKAVYGVFTSFEFGLLGNASRSAVLPVQTGPDSGLYYLQEIPQFTDRTSVNLHPALHGGGGFPLATKWYGDQDGSSPLRCDAAGVARLSVLAGGHEGSNPTADSSHYVILQRFIRAESLSTRFERIVTRAASTDQFWSRIEAFKRDVEAREGARQKSFEGPEYSRIFGAQQLPNGPFGALGCRVFRDSSVALQHVP